MMGGSLSRTKTAPPNDSADMSDSPGSRGAARQSTTPGPPSMAGAAAPAPTNGADTRGEGAGDDYGDAGSAPEAGAGAVGGAQPPSSSAENEEDEMLLSPLESALHHLDALEQDAAEGVGPTLDGPMRRHHLRATRRALEAMVNATGGATTMFTPTILSGLVLNSPKGRARGQPRAWRTRAPPRHPDAMTAPPGAVPAAAAAPDAAPHGYSSSASESGEPTSNADDSGGTQQPRVRVEDSLATLSPGVAGSPPASEGGRRSRLTLGQRFGRNHADRTSSGRASPGRASPGTGGLQRSHSLSSMNVGADSSAVGADTGGESGSKAHGRGRGGSMLSFGTEGSSRERSASYRRLFADRSTRDWLTSQYAAAARVSAVPTGASRRASDLAENGRAHSAEACGLRGKGAVCARTRSILPEECNSLNEDEAVRLEALVKLLPRWDFDIFGLQELCGEATLCVVTRTALSRLGVDAEFSLPCDKVEAFALHVARNYSASVIGAPGSNPYHTALHAADVTQSVLSLVDQHRVLREHCQPMEVLALVLGAAVHDYRHKGVTNAFLAATEHEIAIIYNDASPQENMSLAEAFHALKRPELNAVASLDAEQKTAFRKAMINMVLATDLAKHFDYVGRFKVKAASVRWDDENDRQLVLSMSIKAADIGHPAKPWALHRKWSSMITAEFFRQGDRERELGLPVSPLCDRESVQLPKSQLGFIAFLVRPMFELYCELLGDEVLLRNVDFNEAEWKRQEEEMDGDASSAGSDWSGELETLKEPRPEQGEEKEKEKEGEKEEEEVKERTNEQEGEGTQEKEEEYDQEHQH